MRWVMRSWISIFISFSVIAVIIPFNENTSASGIGEENSAVEILPLYPVSDPISIDSDTALASLAGDKGWPGNGSDSDPYVISDLNIDAMSGGYGLFIGNVTLHLEIDNIFVYNSTYRSSPYLPGSGILIYGCRNVTAGNCTVLKCTTGIGIVDSEDVILDGNIFRNCTDGVRITGSTAIRMSGNRLRNNSGHGAYIEYSTGCYLMGNTVSDNDLGIFLKGCWNNRIENNDCDRNDDHGIRLDGSHTNVITGNICPDNDDGVHLNMGSDGNIVKNNEISNSVEYGMYIENSYGNTFHDNRMNNCSIMILGDRDTYVSQIIPDNNTVNGDPVIYIINRNMTGVVIPPEAGQMIFGNVTGATLGNIHISHVSCGISIAYSEGIGIVNTTITNAIYYGINIDSSTDVEITGSTFENSLFSLYIEDSSMCSLTRNNITESGTGVLLEGSDHFLIHENYLGMNSRGIVLRDGTADSLISGNFIFLHDWSGITLDNGCENITITKNGLHYLEAGMEIYDSDGNYILENDLSYCPFGMIISSSDNNLIKGNDLQHGGDTCVSLIGIANRMESNLFSTWEGRCLSIGGSDNLIVNNSFQSENGMGISLWGDRNRIRENRIETPESDGIRIFLSTDNILESNELIGCSIGIGGDLEHFRRTSIAENNTVNGDPIYHMVDVNTITGDLLAGAGEIIAVNIDNLIISGMDSKDTTSLVILKECHGARIIESNISSKKGIRIEDCTDTIIEDCRFIGGEVNIRFTSGSRSAVRRCSFDSSDTGIFLDETEEAAISWNDFDSVGSGIRISNSMSTQITNNTLDCGVTGISIIEESYLITASDNIIRSESGIGAEMLERVEFCNLTHNTFHNGTTARNENKLNRFFENYWEITDPVDADRDGIHDDTWIIPGNKSTDPRPLLHIPETTLPAPEITIFNITRPNVIFTWDAPEKTRHRNIFNLELYRVLDNGSDLLVTTLPGDHGICGDEIANEGEVYSFTARYRIDYGPGKSCEPVTIIPDWNPPIIEWISPADGVHINQDYVTIRWDHHDSVSGVDRVMISHRHYVEFPELPLPESDLWLDIGTENSYELTGLDEGHHFVTVRAYDVLGQYTDHVFRFVVDMTPPDLEIISPENGSYIDDDDIDLEISYGDSLGVNYTIDIFADGERYFSGFYNQIGILDEWINDLEEGPHEIRVECKDTAGNTAGRTIFITVDTIDPEIISFYPAGYGIDTDTDIWVEFSEPMDQNVTYATINEDHMAITWNGTRMNLYPLWPLLSSEPYEIRIYGADMAGNGLYYGHFSFNTMADPESQFGYLRLMVADENNDPIENARIILNGNLIGHTDSDGIFNMDMRVGEYEMRIEKDGFSTYFDIIYIEYDLTKEYGPVFLDREERSRGTFDVLPLLEVAVVLSFLFLIISSVAIYLIMERRSIPTFEE